MILKLKHLPFMMWLICTLKNYEKIFDIFEFQINVCLAIQRHTHIDFIKVLTNLSLFLQSDFHVVLFVFYFFGTYCTIIDSSTG